MTFTSEQLHILQLFHPYAFRKQKDIRTRKGRFVHYTSAEVAVSVIRNREVWMRKATTMNDFMEIEYGLGCLISAYNGDPGVKFKDTLENIYPGFCTELENRFNGWIPQFKNDTYLTCISEHLESEDAVGRLSMWRAYGGTTGVALVLNNAPFCSPSDALKAYSSPVAYFSPDQFKREFQTIADALEANASLIRTRPQEEIMGYVFAMLRYSMLATKHPGFHEEREWRVIYSPTFESSDNLISDIQIIRGVPQPIYKIPLRDIPEEDFIGAEILICLTE